jgi:hypothetical protein
MEKVTSVCNVNGILYSRKLRLDTIIITLTVNYIATTQHIIALNIEGDQKVSLHLVITVQKVTSSVQSVPRQSPDIY